MSLGGIWRCLSDGAHAGEALGFHRGDFDDSSWPETRLPSLASQVIPGLDGYLGPMWYRRILQIPGNFRGSRIYFQCDAANYHTRLYINGELAGENKTGHLPFDIAIDRLIKPGAWNLLALEVDAIPLAGENPGTLSGWRHVPGILRGVRLETRHPTHIAAVSSWAEPTASGGRLRIGLEIERAPGGQRPQLMIRSADGSWSHAITDDWMDVPGAKPWTIENPRLYEFEVQLIVGGMPVDSVPIRIGFRTIKASGGQILLNDVPVYLCGFNRHEDLPHVAMLADPPATREDLRRMKQAGANFVRLCHYPNDPRTLDMCDEMGMLVMCEIPLHWMTSRGGREQECRDKLAHARDQLQRLIRRDRHRPSVICWSVSSESDEACAEVQDANEELLRLAGELDDSRLVVHVSSSWPTHPRFDLDDVICISGFPNVWPWNAKLPTDLADSAQQWRTGIQRLQKLYPGKPILIASFGYPAIEGNMAAGHWGQQRQADTIAVEAQAFQVSGVCGMTLWCFADHPWPSGTLVDGMETSPFGVFTRSRQPKSALKIVCEIFHEARGLQPAQLPQMPEGPPNVIMIRSDMRDIPDLPLPKGYSMRGMYPGEASVWTDIWRDADPSLVIDDDLFRKEFGEDWDIINQRCLFVIAPMGRAVGTISAWMNPDFRGQDAGRIHWVALRRQWQGAGLSRPMMSKALQLLAKYHQQAYLVTQAFRIPAIALYLKFGFRPDVPDEHAQVLWAYTASQLPHPALDAIRRLTTPVAPVK